VPLRKASELCKPLRGKLELAGTELDRKTTERLDITVG
jgi:hypothetical protein